MERGATQSLSTLKETEELGGRSLKRTMSAPEAKVITVCGIDSMHPALMGKLQKGHPIAFFIKIKLTGFSYSAFQKSWINF